MANAPSLKRRDRLFSLLCLGGICLLLTVGSFLESDTRGLLRLDSPSSFAVEDLDLPDSYALTYLGHQRLGGARFESSRSTPARGARRTVPGRGAPDDRQGATTPVGAIPVSSTPNTSGLDIAGFAPPVQGSQQSSLLSGNGTQRFDGRNLGGGSLPPGLLLVAEEGTPSPPPPVVPAVPEPSTWLLMILGVGFLASAMRASAVHTTIQPSHS